MRKKLLNNNLANSISKGGVLYRPGEIPTLTKEQIAQANLVNKLPRDFPIANWESMGTKQQLQQMKYSGLNAQEQWSLLNSNVPLSALDQYNQAQTQSGSTMLAARVAASLVNTSAQVAAVKAQAAVGKPTVSTPLQTSAQLRKYDVWQEEYAPRYYGKATSGAGAAITPKNTLGAAAAIKPVNRDGQSGNSEGDQGKKESWWDKFLRNLLTSQTQQSVANYSALNNMFTLDKYSTYNNGGITPTSTPLKYNIDLVTPTPSPRMTPRPKPTPTPTPTPTPEPSKRDQIATDVVAYAREHLGDIYSKTGNTGTIGYDCSGLVRAACKAKGAGIIFGQGYVSYSCEDGMAKDLIAKDFCDVKYDYSKGSTFPELKPGDLVFFADPDDLTKDKHVAIATGDGLQVIEASYVVKKVTDEFDAYEREETGHYIRSSGQIVTYVLSPDYDWEEQP